MVEKEVEEAEEINIVQETILSKMQKHRFFFPLVSAIGVILVWRGLWDIFDQIPIISYSAISLSLGLIILWAFNRVKSL